MYLTQVWSEAATQVFYSTGVSTGPIIAMSSFNKFKNDVYRDTLIVCITDTLTSIFAGAVVFSILGFMAREKNVTVDAVATAGKIIVIC